MEGHRLTGQSPQWAVVPMEEEVVPQLAYSPGLSLALFLFLTWNFV